MSDTPGSQPHLRRLHPDTSLLASSLSFWQKQTTEAILESLRTGRIPESRKLQPLLMNDDGTRVMQGNHRVKILEDRLRLPTNDVVAMVQSLSKQREREAKESFDALFQADELED